jgi:CheY-like chemotaxis protein
MDAETKERMWEPYFTTKPTGHGLGLAAVRGIVERVHGHLECRSGPQQGTTIIITFPKHSDAKQCIEPTHMNLPRAPTGRILVVDDDDLMRETLESMVIELGLKPVLAEGGRAALSILSTDADSFDAIVLDCRMPDLDGPTTFHALRRNKVDVPVLLISGHARDEVIRDALADTSTRFLTKPFTTHQLRTALRILRCVEGDDESSSSTNLADDRKH